MTRMEGESEEQKNGEAVNRCFGEPEGAEPYLTKEEVARRLRKPVRTIEDWMRRRIIPFYKLGQAVRFRWSKVQAHFEARYCIGAEKILTTDERELTRMGNLKAERKAEPPYVGCYSKGRQ